MPISKNCGTSQNTDMDAGEALRRRCLSTVAATAMATMVNAMPTPMRFRMLSPRSPPVRRRRYGSRTLSYTATATIMPMAAMAKVDAGGSVKCGPMRRSITLPCLMKKVDTCAAVMPNGSVATQMGTIASTSFVSSTCVTVANRHAPRRSSPPSCSTTAALSRNLPCHVIHTFHDYNHNCIFPQLVGVGGEVEVPLPRGGDEDADERRERAALGDPVPVVAPAGEEDGEGGGHDGGEHDGGGAPADLLLEVDDDGDAEQDAGAERAVPPVEVGHLLHPLRRVAVVELVGAEALQRRLVPAGADRHQVDRHEEERLVEVQVALGDRSLPARNAIRASERADREVDESGEEDSGEAAEVAVGEEAADEGHEGGDAGPVVDILGGELHLLLENLGQVDHQARR
ncbi:Os03g0823550 [Oryza sativa Japonica Group]|uniref:Os03g0823550 protein n=1 Tax=Oryza sativa subsp. japonica TaxID=39947 RepID=A0A0P0W5K2_ORYSJ|nr:hypothetical protein EE612_021375 [Oryza sativa]BAS87124.1 Os03g0823550 [Oryza sativa Japonica Group]